MAKKKNNRPRKQKQKTVKLENLSTEELLSNGNILVSQEKFQEALTYFKHLLKINGNKEALDGLERAYRGRIKALAAKSLIKEALALVGIMAQRCPNADVNSLTLTLMLQAGNYSEAARIYTKCSDRLSPEQRHQLETVFGLIVLVETDFDKNLLPTDSSALRYSDTAMEAVEMFCVGDHDTLKQSLRKIPFRSPYKDLRILLTGLMQLTVNKEQGEEILHKIRKGSPYFSTASSYLFSTGAPQDILTHLGTAPAYERAQFRELHNIPFDSFKALEKLSQTDDSPLSLVHFISRNSKCFNKQQKRELLRSILPFCGIDASPALERSKDFTMPEKYCLLALAAEKDGALSFAVDFWDDYLNSLDQDDTAHHGEIALVLRRQATLMEHDHFEFDPEETIETLLDSLKYDPAHPETWLKAARLAEEFRTRYKYNTILDDAVKQLPDNIAVLLAAMKASGNRNAHKKAAGFAERVLVIDSINTTALDFLVESHLEHGCKLALQGKWALAEKELEKGDSRVKAVRLRGRNQICFGIVKLLQGEEDGLHHIDSGQNINGYPILGHLLTSLEARRYSMPLKWKKEFDKRLRQTAKSGADVNQSEFLRLISWLNSSTGKQWLFLKEVCHELKQYFSKGAALKWKLEEGLQICKGLERADLIPALAKCAAGLHKEYPEVEECTVWYLLSGILKKNNSLTLKTSHDLNYLLDSLEKNNKTQFTSYIENILHMRRVQLSDISFLDDLEDFLDDFEPEPFFLPKKESEPKSNTKKKKTKPKAKQLNLFEDL